MTPTQRSLQLLRDEQWLVAIVEKWNQWAKVRVDLFGFGDLLALRGETALIVQTTSGSNVAARIAKIQASAEARVWLQAPNHRIEVHGWRKVGARGKRKVWECREVPLFLDSCGNITANTEAL